MIEYRDAKIRKIHTGNKFEYEAKLSSVRLRAPDIANLKAQIDYHLDQKNAAPVRKSKAKKDVSTE